MKPSRTFPFEKSRRLTNAELEAHRKAIGKKLGEPWRHRGRPLKNPTERYRAIAIRLHPKILLWAKTEAKKKGIGYQTVINRILLKFAA